MEDEDDDSFWEVLSEARITAFAAKYDGKTFEELIDEYIEQEKKSFSISVPINDSTALKNGVNAVSGSNVTAATITGNVNGSYNGNIPFGDFSDSDYEMEAGNTASYSTSGTVTYNISGGSYKKTDGGNTYQISGIITVQLEMVSRGTLVSLESDMADEKSTGEFIMKGKVTAALSISDGTKGGKFVCSSAFEQSQALRTVVERTEEIVSDIEVYNNVNAKIVTLNSDNNGIGDIIYYLGLSIAGL